MKDEWRPIKGYEGLYEVSSSGCVRSLKRKTTNGRILIPVKTNAGYYRITLSKNGERRNFTVHRLVAEAFLDNPERHPSINHKNEDKGDNRAENLEWCTVKYNNEYNGRQAKVGEKRKVPIEAEKNGVKLFFDGIVDAARSLGVSHGDISGCVRGYYGRKSLGGYTFRRMKDALDHTD